MQRMALAGCCVVLVPSWSSIGPSNRASCRLGASRGAWIRPLSQLRPILILRWEQFCPKTVESTPLIGGAVPRSTMRAISFRQTQYPVIASEAPTATEARIAKVTISLTIAAGAAECYPVTHSIARKLSSHVANRSQRLISLPRHNRSNRNPLGSVPRRRCIRQSVTFSAPLGLLFREVTPNSFRASGVSRR